MEPLNPVREGYVTRINEAPEPKGEKLFAVPDTTFDDVPDSPPVEALDALDRAARVMAELGRKNVTVALETPGGATPLRVLLQHPGTASVEISHNALLNLLDGDLRLFPGGRGV